MLKDLKDWSVSGTWCKMVAPANVFVVLGFILSIVFISTLVLLPFAVIALSITLALALAAAIAAFLGKCYKNMIFSLIIFLVIVGLLIDNQVKKDNFESSTVPKAANEV